MSKRFAGKKAVSIKREFYTMATVNGDEAEIVMYGNIVSRRPVDWWTDEPIDGDFIILSEFLKDLKQVEGVKKLTLRINSVGGNAYDAITIHNRIRELARSGTEVTAQVDGVAMSGGSLIMCAADTVRVNPSSLIMIHKCWSFLFGGYNAKELREIATSNDAVDKAQAAIYHGKSEINEADILAMMDATTYMTGAEAVEKGFADELTDADRLEIAASADTRTLYVNGRAFRMPGALLDLPDTIPTFNPASDEADLKNDKQPEKPAANEGGTLMAKNLEELRAENPELAELLMSEAAAAASADKTAEKNAGAEEERKRIAEIDKVAALFDDETVHKAKYGDKPCTAQEMAYNAAIKAAEQGKTFVTAMEQDTEASGAQGVPGATPPAGTGGELTPEQLTAKGRADAKALRENKEEK